MRHMLVPVGKESRVRERGDIEGSYPSFCYSAADSFAALVRDLAATSTGREKSTDWGKAPEKKEELHLVGEKSMLKPAHTHTYKVRKREKEGDHTLSSYNNCGTNKT